MVVVVFGGLAIRLPSNLFDVNDQSKTVGCKRPACWTFFEAARRNLEAASKALELAARELDKLIEPSTPDEERKMRKRRLLKGPKEFRDIRGDISKSNR